MAITINPEIKKKILKCFIIQYWELQSHKKFKIKLIPIYQYCLCKYWFFNTNYIMRNQVQFHIHTRHLHSIHQRHILKIIPEYRVSPVEWGDSTKRVYSKSRDHPQDESIQSHKEALGNDAKHVSQTFSTQ